MRKVVIVVSTDGTCTRATTETFRKLGEGHAIDADAILWVSEEQAEQLLSGVIYVSLGYLPNPQYSDTREGQSFVCSRCGWIGVVPKSNAYCLRCGCVSNSKEMGITSLSPFGENQ